MVKYGVVYLYLDIVSILSKHLIKLCFENVGSFGVEISQSYQFEIKFVIGIFNGPHKENKRFEKDFST